MMLSPLTFKNVMAALSLTMYATYIAAVMEALKLQVTTKCVTSYSTLIDYPYPLTTYVVNPSSDRSAAYHRRLYVRGGVDLRQELTSSF